MYVIVGLGNIGRKYDNTRHNVGFEFIDYLSRKYDIKVTKSKFKSLVGEGRINGEKVVLIKPQTYMNLSGEAVIRVLKYYEIELENLIIVYDDVDTDIGKIRIRKKGSAGTHNGMRNIIYLLNDDKFPRIRIGIGTPNIPIEKYVLSRFKKDEIPYVEESIINASLALEVMIKENIDKAMNLYNKR